MSGFRYLTSGGSNINRFRHYMVLMGQRNCKVGTFTQGAGVTGNKVVTGVGFQPDALMIFGTVQSSATFQDFGCLHVGFADGTNEWAQGWFWSNIPAGGSGARQDVVANDQIIYSLFEGVEAVASFVSFDADGFTINFSDAPAISTLYVYMALAGQSYHVGTDNAPIATGTQAITGLGFEPTAVFLASTQADNLSTVEGYAKATFGGGDAVDQFSVWAGSEGTDIYNNQVAQSHALSMFQDSAAAGPFLPVLMDEADIISLDADGFTLDWTTVSGDEPYFSWFATDGYATIDRFTYNHGDGETARVSTQRRPRGMIFFQNDMGTESTAQVDTEGATIAIGVVGPDTTQYTASIVDKSQPEFSIIQAGRELRANTGFGAYHRTLGGLPGGLPNNMQDRGFVTFHGRDHLLRLHLGQ